MISLLILIVYALTLVPVIFLNFDSHHDGLIVQTVINLKESIRTNGSWPYNQYGSFWIFIFTFGTWFLPTDLILLGIRIITLVCYWMSGWLIYQLTLFFSTKKLAIWTAVYLFISHPFYGGWNSSFLPWPSAIAMPLILGVCWLLTSYEVKSKEDIFQFKPSKKSFVFIGVLTSMILGTRLQIGILLIIFICLFLWLGNKHSETWIFIITLAISISVWSAFLRENDWLNDAFDDSVRLASTFLSGDRIHYPFPGMTMLLSFIIAIGVILLLEYKVENLRIIGTVGILLAIPLIIYGMYKLHLVQNLNNNIANYIALSQRKLMAGMLFGSLLASSYLLARALFELKKQFLVKDREWVLLFGFSAIAAFQSWPFFDQMHIWWASVPGIILIVTVLDKIRIKVNLKFNHIIVLSIIIMSCLFVPLTAQLLDDRKELRSTGLSNVYVLSKYEDQNMHLKRFFTIHIPNGSSVLNLCPNPDVFFVDSLYYQANRFPVYWSTFSRINSIQSQFEYLNPKFIVTCKNGYYNQNQTYKYLSLQEEIIKKQNIKYRLKSIHVSGDFYWKIFVSNSG
jgi:hypothetical protein